LAYLLGCLPSETDRNLLTQPNVWSIFGLESTGESHDLYVDKAQYEVAVARGFSGSGPHVGAVGTRFEGMTYYTIECRITEMSAIAKEAASCQAQ
jgi:hypothetical protein